MCLLHRLLLNLPVVNNRNISVNVTDGEKAVASAKVLIDGKTKVTGSAGGCTFNGVSDGEHSVIIKADGFNDYTGIINVSESVSSFSFVLTAVD